MLYQNSAYWYDIEIEDLKDISTIQKVEFSFGELKKEYPSDNVLFENGVFRVRFSQPETVALNGIVDIQARVKFGNGDVLPTNIERGNVVSTVSKTEI